MLNCDSCCAVSDHHAVAGIISSHSRQKSGVEEGWSGVEWTTGVEQKRWQATYMQVVAKIPACCQYLEQQQQQGRRSLQHTV